MLCATPGIFCSWKTFWPSIKDCCVVGTKVHSYLYNLLVLYSNFNSLVRFQDMAVHATPPETTVRGERGRIAPVKDCCVGHEDSFVLVMEILLSLIERPDCSIRAFLENGTLVGSHVNHKM